LAKLIKVACKKQKSFNVELLQPA